MGLFTNTWIQNPRLLEIISLGCKSFLQSRSSGLMKSDMQDELVVGHGFSIPEGLGPNGSKARLVF
jgi:hypothetical protein